MKIEKLKKFFKEKGIENRIKEFDVSSATVELAAKALGCSPEKIAKTLSFKIEKEGKTTAILIVTAGDTKIDNSKYKAKFETKAKMLSPEEVEIYTGYQIGGVCPFLIPEEVKIYLDESLKRFTTIFPACGSSNSAIELSTKELEECVGMIEWINVCKTMDIC